MRCGATCVSVFWSAKSYRTEGHGARDRRRKEGALRYRGQEKRAESALGFRKFGMRSTSHKDVLVEINPMPPPRTRLQFVNLGTSSPRLELEDGTVYVGEFHEIMGSVLVFRETQVTADAREDQASDGDVGRDDGIHGVTMARLEEAPAVGKALSQGGAKARQKTSRVETMTELQGVANVKLVFTLKKS